MNAAETLPLAGITVVALEQAVAAPFASRQLADLGARVIKVERPDGGDFARGYDEAVHGESSYFVWLNRGKESVCLDLKEPGDAELLRTMLAEADVFLHNLAPGAIERLGFADAALRERHPALITCSVSGFGPDGPQSRRKAYDLLVQCEAGLLSVTGTPDEEVKVGISIVDIATGMYAYSGVLTALLRRQATGLGTHVEVSMLDAIGEWMMQPFLYAAHAGRPPARTGARHASIAPYGPFSAADGKVFLAVQNDREWRRLCTEVLDDAELADDARFRTNAARSSHVAELTAHVERRTAAHTRASLAEALDRAGIANAEMRSVAELDEHPQLDTRDRWVEIDTAGGPARVLRPAATIAGVPAVMGPVPALGEQDAAIRAEFAGPRS